MILDARVILHDGEAKLDHDLIVSITKQYLYEISLAWQSTKSWHWINSNQSDQARLVYSLISNWFWEKNERGKKIWKIQVQETP